MRKWEIFSNFGHQKKCADHFGGYYQVLTVLLPGTWFLSCLLTKYIFVLIHTCLFAPLCGVYYFYWNEGRYVSYINLNYHDTQFGHSPNIEGVIYKGLFIRSLNWSKF